jgi:hypothetical protein
VSDKRLTDSELEAVETFATPMMSTALVRLVAEVREHRTRTAPAGLPVDPEADALAAKALNARAKEPRKLAAGLTQEERAALEFARNMADSAAWNDDQRRCVRVLDRLLASTAPAHASGMRQPLPVDVLADARHDRIHEDAGPSRPARVASPAPASGGSGAVVVSEEKLADYAEDLLQFVLDNEPSAGSHPEIKRDGANLVGAILKECGIPVTSDKPGSTPATGETKGGGE